MNCASIHQFWWIFAWIWTLTWHLLSVNAKTMHFSHSYCLRSVCLAFLAGWSCIMCKLSAYVGTKDRARHKLDWNSARFASHRGDVKCVRSWCTTQMQCTSAYAEKTCTSFGVHKHALDYAHAREIWQKRILDVVCGRQGPRLHKRAQSSSAAWRDSWSFAQHAQDPVFNTDLQCRFFTPCSVHIIFTHNWVLACPLRCHAQHNWVGSTLDAIPYSRLIIDLTLYNTLCYYTLIWIWDIV